MAGFILGYESQHEAAFGFHDVLPAKNQHDPICFEGDEPICIIAPTGAGKGRDVLVPNILTHDGPLIVTDFKGELASVCARRRREMGYEVAVLDPFGKTRFASARLNPLDLLSLPGALLESDAEMLAAQLGEDHQGDRDPFWNSQASSLIAGLLVGIQTGTPEGRNLRTLTEMLFSEDVTYNLAVYMDTMGDKLPKYARRAIAAFFQSADSTTRPGILNTAQTYTQALGSEDVAACLVDSTINLDDVIAGKSLDIFLCIPPDKLKSHKCLIRLWVGTLIKAIMRRTEIPEKRTLMILDEAAQLGEFEPLLTACTLLRGFGLQLATVWQDLAQIKSRYKTDWPTILNNAAALISFGQGHYAAAKEYAEILGIPADELLKLKADHAVLSVRGEGSRKIRRMNYLDDPMFTGMADRNPYFVKRRGIGR